MGVETMMLAAAAASATGSLLQGVDAYQTSRYNAAVLRNQADAARGDAGTAAQLALEDGARTTGRAVTIAAKGGGLNGSAMDVLSDLSRQSMYEVRRIAVQGANQGQALEADAKEQKRQGNFALLRSVVQAGATMAGAPNGKGDGTLLTDAMARRSQRGAGGLGGSRVPSTMNTSRIPTYNTGGLW